MATEQIAVIIGAVLGAGGLGAVLTYLIARRGTSGSVAVTTADRLWDERRDFSELQRTEIADLRQRSTVADLARVNQDSRINRLELDNRECNNRADRLEARLHATEALLSAKVEKAEAQVERAEAQVTAAEQATKNVEQKHEITELKKANGGSL